jgi:hypothetical protein
LTQKDYPAWHSLIDRRRLQCGFGLQQGGIRLGGYYEVEIKGAAAFEGPTLGVGVRPIMSEKLVK